MNSTLLEPSWLNQPSIYVLLFVSVGVVGVNLITLVVFMKSHIALTMKLLSGHLSAVHVIQGVLIIVASLPSGFLTHFPYGDTWVQIFGLLHIVLFFLTTHNVMFIVVDRYLLVCHHDEYKVWVTHARVISILTCSWLLWVTTTALMFISTPKVFYYEPRLLTCLPLLESSAFSLHMLLGPVLTTCVVVFCYIRLIQSVMRFNIIGTEQDGRSQMNWRDVKNFKPATRKRKSAVFVSLLLFLYVLPMVPRFALMLLFEGNTNMLQESQWLVVVKHVFGIVHVSLCMLGYQPFRKAFKNIFCKRYRHKHQNRNGS